MKSSLLLGLLVLAIGAPHAQADTLDPYVEERLTGVAQFYGAESGSRDLGCNADCEALYADLGRPATVVDDRIPADLQKSFVEAPAAGRTTIPAPYGNPNSYPFLERAGAARMALRVSVAGALVELNFLVWKIVVDELNGAYFVGMPEDAYSVPTISNWGWSDGRPTGGVTYPTYFELPNPIPVGFVAESPGLGAIIWQTGGTRCPSGASPGSAAYIEEFAWVWNRCFEGYDQDGNEILSWRTAHGLHIKNQYLFPTLDADATPDSPWVIHTHGTTLTQAQIEQRLRELLTGSDPDYEEFETWLNAALGGTRHSPRDSTTLAPSCTGVTASTCATRLRAAGFGGQIDTQVVSSDDAALDLPAGQMIDSDPVLQKYLPETGTITLYSNPTTLPELTGAESALAQQLQDENPTTINATNAETIARRCARTMIAAGKPTSTCSSLPLLVQGNDIKVPARNQLVAQARNPVWAVLNRRTDVARTAWYRGRTEPSPGCPQPTPTNQSCDEFPFWTTLQAHGGTLNGGVVPGIRWAATSEQGRQGRILRQFFSSSRPTPSLPFKGCTIAEQPATDMVPLPASTFATIGVPYGVPSTSACNKP